VDLTIEPLGLNQLVLEVRENLAHLVRGKKIVVRLEGLRLDSFPYLIKPLVMEELLSMIGDGPPQRPG